MTEGEVGGGAASCENQHVGLSLASAGANANGIAALLPLQNDEGEIGWSGRLWFWDL